MAVSMAWVQQDYDLGLMSICEALDLYPELESREAVYNCRCALGARTGQHFSQHAADEIKSLRFTLDTLRSLAFAEGSLGADDLALVGAVDLNLGLALNNPYSRVHVSILRAAYCLGKLNERLLHRAGCIDGYRNKAGAHRQEVRDYAEVAREMLGNLETLLGNL